MNHFTTQDSHVIAETAVRIMVGEAIQQLPAQGMWVLFDEDSELAKLIARAYESQYPWAIMRRWDPTEEGEVKRAIQALEKGTLVVLVQSTNFRLNAFRMRLELFARGLKTIEHVHLARMKTMEEQRRYLEGMVVPPSYFTTQANHICKTLQSSAWVEATSVGGETIRWQGPFEEGKRNVGDYTGMTNVGGTFPIGEVFTEAKDVFTGNGSVRVFAMANQDFQMERFESFVMTVENGLVVLRGDEPDVFRQVIDLISKTERPLVREIGFGLNPAFGKDAFVGDVTAFERQRGLHLSIGEKHSIYPKPGLKKRDEARYHVDVFVDVETIVTSEGVLYRDGDYIQNEL